MNDKAALVEAGQLRQRRRPVHPAAAAAAAERLAAKQARQAARQAALPPPLPQYEVRQILAEEHTTGAARCYYLVEWAGYDVSWEAWRISGEPGTPLRTWEPLKFVRRTEAFQAWQAARAPAAAPLL